MNKQILFASALAVLGLTACEKTLVENFEVKNRPFHTLYISVYNWPEIVYFLSVSVLWS